MSKSQYTFLDFEFTYSFTVFEYETNRYCSRAAEKIKKEGGVIPSHEGKQTGYYLGYSELL